MNTIVVSYSLTGNNRRLAQSVAAGMNCRHIELTENKERRMGTSVLDLLLNRTPKVTPAPDLLAGADAVLLAGPIWIGSVATPLRAYLKSLRKMRCPYAFLSISGGADGTNPKVQDELTRRVRRAPLAVVDLHIADLLPGDPAPTRETTSAYKITDQDVESLTVQALEKLGALTGKEQML